MITFFGIRLRVRRQEVGKALGPGSNIFLLMLGNFVVEIYSIPAYRHHLRFSIINNAIFYIN